MANKKRKPVKKVQDASPLAREIILLVIIVFSILSLLSLFDLCGAGGRLLSGLLFGLFGAVSYIFPICLLVASGFFISNPDNSELKRKIIYSAGLYICLCGIFQWVIDSKAEGLIEVFKICSSERTGGGLLGGILSYLLTLLAGRAGSLVIILGLTLLFVMLITRKLIFAAIRDLYEEKTSKKDYIEYEDYEEQEEEPAQRQMKVHTFEKKKGKDTKRKRKKAQIQPVEPEVQEEEKTEQEQSSDAVTEEPELPNISIIRGGSSDSAGNPVYQEELDTKFGNHIQAHETEKKEQTTKEQKIRESKKKEIKMEDPQAEIQQIEEEIKKPEPQQESAYVFPSLDLLSQPKAGNKGLSDKDLIDTAAKLQGTLESFGVKVKMGDVSCGPSVTRYELVPEQGVKVSSITRLADDIKLSLAASDIRIEAPIPGKAAVGIEVPNAKRNMVTLRELLESREFQSAKSNVSFAVGKDISGKTIVTDIAKMPHMLVDVLRP